jgi:undecaprenyl pyrophosphate synthase
MTEIRQKANDDVLTDLESITTPEIEYVTVYGVSTENWQRASVETKEIFAVMEFTALRLLPLQRKEHKQFHQQHPPWWFSTSKELSLSIMATILTTTTKVYSILY